MTSTAARRVGFTLVELLVAIAIAIAILGLALYVANSATFESYKVVGSGDRLSQWLMIAKNRALRDKTPRGIRLFVTTNPATPTLQQVTECAYIEQPDAWIPSDPGTKFQVFFKWSGSAYTSNTSANPAPQPNVTGNVYLTLSGNDVAAFSAAGVQQGDTIVVPDIGIACQALSGPTAPDADAPAGVSFQFSVALLPDLGAANTNTTGSTPTVATYQTSNFGIYRQPQLLLGEPTLQIPSGMAIDVANSVEGSSTLPLSGTSPNQFYDILFAPGGEVIGKTTGFIGLLLRDVNRVPASVQLGTTPNPNDYDKAGEMIAVAIYTRTGAIATQPVANVAGQAGGDQFNFAKDAINTGL